MSENAGLVQRGLMLLAVMVLLAGFVLFALIRRPDQAVPAAQAAPEAVRVLIALPPAPFPASLGWAGLYQLGNALPSAPGWEIRYNAAATLARRGNAAVPWNLLAEMLDESRQMRNFRVVLQDGRQLPDEAAARRTILTALRAVADWHKKQDASTRPATLPPGLRAVYAAVDRLTRSPILEIRAQAERTQAVFFREPPAG
jgi:hypothetical protein